MADNRYDNGAHQNRHTPPMSSPMRSLALNDWTYSHWNEKHRQPVYKLGEAKLMFYQDNWLVEYPHIERPVFYRGWPIDKVTEDVKKELSK